MKKNNQIELWKTLKYHGLPFEKETGSKISSEEHGGISFNASEKTKTIRRFFSNLAEFLLKNLSEGASKFGFKNKRTILLSKEKIGEGQRKFLTAKYVDETV